MRHTVIALFDEAKDAHKAAEAVKAAGFDASAVHITRGPDTDDTHSIPPAAEIESGPLTGLLHRLSVLFGVEEPHLPHYQEAVRRRGNVVQVDAADEGQAATARDTLLAMNAVNIDDRVAQWEQEGWQSLPADAQAASPLPPAGGFVHRQEVSIGGVRVYGQAAAVSFDDLAAAFRADFETRHAASGASYADFEPAYRFGHALASDARYVGRSWADVAAGARSDWESRHPPMPWERFRSAVQYAWEQATNR